MGVSFYMDWEVSFLEFLQSFRSPLLDALAKGITLLGDQYMLILLTGLCYWCIDKRLGRSIALAVTGSILSCSLIQGLVQRRRPYMDHSEITCIRAAFPKEDPMLLTAQGSSCPSMHSALSVGGYGTLALGTKKKFTAVPGFIIPLLIGFSRLYLGVHYPTDVLAGWVTGAAVMAVFCFVERRLGYKAGFCLQLALGAAGFFWCKDNGFFTIYGVILGLVFGFRYEEKHVQFEMSKKWWSYILRPVLGALVFGIVSALLKLPAEHLFAQSPAAFLSIYRTLRYGIASFVTIGLYPHLFRRVRFL